MRIDPSIETRRVKPMTTYLSFGEKVQGESTRSDCKGSV